MATCIVSGTLIDPSSTAISGATIKANIVGPDLNSGTSLVVPKEISTTSASDGTWSLTLARNLSCSITIEYPQNSTDSSRRASFSIVVPNTPTASFSTLLTEL